MRTRTRRSAIVSILAAIGLGLAGTGCSSSDGAPAAAASSTEAKPGQPYPGYSASIVPDPTSLEAETAEPTEPAETTQEPTPQVDSDVAREANLTPCEASLDLDVIDTTVKGASEVRLDEIVVNDTSKFVQYSETCRYVLSGSGNRVASVTSTLLTDAGKTFYRNTCADGDMNSRFLDGDPIPYQYYGNVDDGCTFAPTADAPGGTLPGFVLRYRDKMVTVYLSGFDTLANDGEAVIRKVKLRS